MKSEYDSHGSLDYNDNISGEASACSFLDRLPLPKTIYLRLHIFVRTHVLSAVGL